MKMYIVQYQWGFKNVNDVHLIHLGGFKPTRFSWMDSVLADWNQEDRSTDQGG